MRTLKEFIFTVNFRHVYAVLVLISFLIITTLPFWIGSKGLSTQAWTYLTASQGALTVLLTLAGRRYFEHKKDEQTIIKEQGLPVVPPSVGDNAFSGIGTPNSGVQTNTGN